MQKNARYKPSNLRNITQNVVFVQNYTRVIYIFKNKIMLCFERKFLLFLTTKNFTHFFSSNPYLCIYYFKCKFFQTI